MLVVDGFRVSFANEDHLRFSFESRPAHFFRRFRETFIEIEMS
jgi:hypothetical protein